MTKIDVLNIFEHLSAVTQYEIGGQASGLLPFDLSAQDLKPVLQDFDGWGCELDYAAGFDGLPKQAKTYIKALESYLGLPFSMISTGPEREKLIIR